MPKKTTKKKTVKKISLNTWINRVRKNLDFIEAQLDESQPDARRAMPIFHYAEYVDCAHDDLKRQERSLDHQLGAIGSLLNRTETARRKLTALNEQGRSPDAAETENLAQRA